MAKLLKDLKRSGKSYATPSAGGSAPRNAPRHFVRHAAFIALALCLALAACGKAPLKDGEWSGKSGPDDTGAWGEISVTVRDGKVAACTFITRQKDGTIKGEDYGKINGEIANADFYEKAQLAVRAMDRYAQQFTETGSLNQVDAVSGATTSHKQFVEAVERALAKARE